MADHIPAGRPPIIPRLIAEDTPGLVAFVKSVFGATGELQENQPTELAIGDGLIMISDGGGLRAPTRALLYVYVPDVEVVFARAVRAGAKIVEEPKDQFYGDRRATFDDKWGNGWQVATPLR